MNELITFIDNTRLSEKDRAVKLHENIIIHASLATEHLFEFYKSLKYMKDTELYKQLGYNTFEQYTEGALGIKQRQAYSYISAIEKLGEDYIAKNSTLGVSKLALLAAASVAERDELQKVDIENKSVRELQDALKEIQNLKKQLTFLEEEKDMPKKEKGISEEEIKELIAKAEEDARANALQGYAGNIKALEIEKKAAEDAKKEAERQRAIVVEKAKGLEQELELEKKQVKLDPELQGALDRMKEEKEKLEKQLKVSSNPVMTEFKFMLKNLQDEFNQVQSFAAASEEKDKMLMALKKVVQSLADKIQV